MVLHWLNHQKSLGLKRIHSPKSPAMVGQDWPFALGVGKKVKMSWTMLVNHLQTMYYYLVLICAHCVGYFTALAQMPCVNTPSCTNPCDNQWWWWWLGGRRGLEGGWKWWWGQWVHVWWGLNHAHLAPHPMPACSKLTTVHWCSCQGRLFLPSPSSNSIPYILILYHIPHFVQMQWGTLPPKWPINAWLHTILLTTTQY